MSPIAPGPVVAIHQPNFFPWLGYFDKIARADSFIILDTVQHQKKAGNWSNRVKLLVNGEARWVSAPIDRRFHGVRAVGEIGFGGNEDWRGKMERTIQVSYSRAPFREEASALILPLLRNPDQGLATYNRAAIMSIAEALGIDTGKIRPASEMAGEGASNELLVSLIRQARGKAYLCGGGADGYQDEQVFADAGIALIHQDYRCPSYPQHGNRGEFVPSLSVIDALMNVGLAGTRALLAEGRGNG